MSFFSKSILSAWWGPLKEFDLLVLRWPSIYSFPMWWSRPGRANKLPWTVRWLSLARSGVLSSAFHSLRQQCSQLRNWGVLAESGAGNQKEGFAPLNGSFESMLAGATLTRQDFQKAPRDEAALVKACKAQAIVLVFAASDRDGVNKLIAANQLLIKLALARSGCGSNVPNGPPK